MSFDLWGHTDLDIEISKDAFPDEAWIRERDVLFDNPQHGFFESCHKAKKLHYRKNLPPKDTPIRAIIVWQHGILGQSGTGMKCSSDGRYTDMALHTRMMNAKGYAVYAHDQLGHGFSEGERFCIPNGDWKINRDDLVCFARFAADEHPEGTPLFLAGSSYGGCLALHAAYILQTEKPENVPKGFLGCALMSPALDGYFPAWPVLFFLGYMFPLWTPYFMPHPMTPDKIWKEAEARQYFTDQNESNGLSQIGMPYCMGTAAGLVSAIQTAQKLFSHISVPFHINHGSDDYGVPSSGSQQLFKESKTPSSAKELNIVPGGYHALLSQLDAEETMRHELNWIEKTIEKDGRE